MGRVGIEYSIVRNPWIKGIRIEYLYSQNDWIRQVGIGYLIVRMIGLGRSELNIQ